MPHPSASVPTPTTSGSDLSVTELARWRRRLRDRLVVQRDLPWRHTRDPWLVLIAEVMLQQTQVARAVPAFQRFSSQFPDPHTCASARRSEVVTAWAGLGYHRRAVALHEAAKSVVNSFGGAVPNDLDALRTLPGVGPYTARAVMAFAFEDDVAVVDTNVARVLSRAVVGRPLSAGPAQTLADSLLSKGRGWSHNQAMLDLGASHCTATPSCAGCPLRRSCRWAATGWAAPDPAWRTAGTSRPQSRFAGSNREARGIVLARARTGPIGPTDLADLSATLGDERVTTAVAGLVADGLLKRSRGGLRLA